MSLPWFRMYTDFMTDWRIEALAFEDQRHYVFLLCAKCAGFLDEDYPNEAIRDRAISRRLGLQGEALDNAKQRLLEVGLITADWQPAAWEKRQHASDSAAERMRKHRERKRKSNSDGMSDAGVTAELRNGDVIDTDTDTDPPISPKGDGFEKFWTAYPKKRSRGQAEKAWAKLKPSEHLTGVILRAVEKAKTSADWLRDGGQFVPYPATWLNAKGWEDDIASAPPERRFVEVR